MEKEVEVRESNKPRILIIISIAIVILVIALVYINFFYAKKCADDGCFYKAMEKCSRVSYSKEQDNYNSLWKISGKSKNNCIIQVKVLEIKKNSTNLAGLNGKSMECELPRGIKLPPDKEINRCSGLLKEELQRIKINELSAYIADKCKK